MPIFHFDMPMESARRSGGLDCASEHDAKRTADLIARQIAIDLVGDRESRSSWWSMRTVRKSTRRQ